jgi:uncharacterized protein
VRRLIPAFATLALAFSIIPAVGLAAGPGVSINEIRIDQPSTDNDEYFELAGAPGTDLSSYTYIVIGDGTGGSGVIEAVVDLSGRSINTDGFFVAAESTFSLATADFTTSLNFENSDNVTHLLVTGFSGANGDDLDTNDDGILDSTPWASIVDSVALVETLGSGDQIYSATTVGPDGSFVPGHAYDCVEDGWLIGAFDPIGGDDTPGAVNPCDAPPPPVEVFIHDVQGPGSSTPIPGTDVIVEGIVVGDFQGNAFAGDQLNGFFVQEESSDWDGDANTSEGVFVFAPGATEVSVGDVVSVTGTTAEFFGKTQITDVTAVSITGSASAVATPVSLPVSDPSDWEKHEGMLVTFPQDLYISEFFNFDRFGEVVLTTARQFQGTHVTDPGAGANAIAQANGLARIILDDGRGSQNPDPAIHPNGAEFTLTNFFRGGDILQDTTGVIDFSFSAYRVQPVHDASPNPTYINANPRPTAPDPIPGDIRVASFNVLNFFTHLDDGVNDICGPTGNLECRGADDATEYQRQLDKLVAGIIALDADIVGIQEIENDIRTDDGDRKHDAVLALVEELNTVEGAGTWAWVGEADHYNNYPVRNEIIYRASAVRPVGDPVAYADASFDDTRPGDIEPLGRPPMAQTFRPLDTRGSRQRFTVVVNHFKSKGSSCSSIGDPDIGDGQANCNLTRVAQSEALLDFVADLEVDSSGVLVIGDLNSYAMEDPITTLEDGGLTELVKQFIGPDAYSFVFDGQLGYLDTALATRSMLTKVVGVTVFHINADEPDILDYDTSFKKAAQDALYEPLPYRVSDHDPVIVGLRFGGKK